MNKKKHQKEEKYTGTLSLLLPYILIVVCFILFMLHIVNKYHPVTVNGHSMEPTYENFDILETATEFTRKDISYNTVICFDPKDGNGVYIKRVVGLPGDHIKIDEKGLWRNEKLINEKLDKPAVYGTYLDVTLGNNEYYVLGDNRDDSRDSRVIGPVKYDTIKRIVKGRFTEKELLPGGKENG